MATYEEYMSAARNADAAGDQAAARQLVQAAIKARGEQAEPQPSGLKLGTLRENIVGEGEVDTVGEYAGELIQSAGAGALRGVKGLLDLPSDVSALSSRLVRGAFGAEPVPEGLRMGDIVPAVAGEERVQYRSPTTAGQYAGTVGEFLPSALGGGAGALKAAVTAGLGSEAAGQATEGTEYEPIARVAGAFLAPLAPSTLAGIKNKTVKAFQKKAIEQPSVKTARDAKNAAYKNFKDVGGKIDVSMDGVNRYVAKAIADDADDIFVSYVPNSETGKFVDNALAMISKHTGKTLNIAQVDKLRAGMSDLYRRSNFQPEVAFIRDKLDEVIDMAPMTGNQKASDALKLARADNRRFKKIELFEELMDKAQRGAAATGSGGNVVNKYRQAVASILNSTRNKAKFDSEEIKLMEDFVQGTMSENTMRLIGKLSPTGNGLMQALNIGAIVNNPAFAVATISGAAAKAGAEGKAVKSLDAIRNMITSGMAPEKRGLITDKDIITLLGLQAD